MPDLPTGSITFLLTDVEGSTKLWEQHPEAMDAALGRHNTLAAEIVHHQGGTLVKQRGEGDSLFAVFARATDALAAATTLQQVLCSEPWPAETPLRVRMALHTGDAALREGDYYGTAVNRCARLRAAAHGGQVLLSQTTCDLVREHLPAHASLRALGSHRLKDLQQPELIFLLLHPDLPADFPPLRSLEAFAHNLPAQLTSFIGREAEMAEVKQSLAATRLLTLTGSGGCGKTRLGLQVAADLIDGFESGVFFVDLAPVRDPGLVASAIAQTLGIRERVGQPLLATLTESLREKHLLLLLDNFEHVLTAAPLVADLLATTPRVRVMITSRAVLHLRGEKEFPVPPLALPDLRQWSMVDGRWQRVSGQTPQPPTIDQQPSTILQYPAVELFIERALDVKSDFQLTSENAAAVAEICCCLDGLPLAIELAARRVKLFTPQALLARLGSRLKLLVGGARDLPARQQTLRSTIAWSYDLLDESEKRLFRRLSVFVGGCTLEAAEAICCDGEVAGPGARKGGGSGDVLTGNAGIPASTSSPPYHLAAGDILDLLASLVDRSLVRREEGEKGEPRFGMLETIREFALECLIASTEASSNRFRHAHHFLALGGQVVNLTRAAQEEWLEQLVRDQNNLRAALDWFEAEDGGAESGLWLMWGLWRLWVAQGYVSEGRERLSRLLALAAPAPTSPRAAGLTLGGVLARIQLDYGSARSLLHEALVIWRQLDDQPDVALTLVNLGIVAVEQGDYEQADRLSAEALTLSQTLNSEWLTAFSLYATGFQSYARGDLVPAARFFSESVALYRTQGEEWLIVMPLLCLGKIACQHSNYQQAEVHFRESLDLCHGVRDRSFVAPSLEGLAEVAAAHGLVARATRLCGAAEALRDALGLPVPEIDQAMYTMNVSSLRAAIGAPSFAATWAEGRAMPLEDVIRYAREV